MKKRSNAQRRISNTEKLRASLSLIRHWTLGVGRSTFSILMDRNDNAALLIVGHGSTVNPSSSAPTLRHAAAIRSRGIFADVACCFWKEEPSLRDALLFFRDPAIRDV